MTLSEERLREILVGLEGVTPGPWDHWDMDEFGFHVFADKYGTREVGQDCRLSLAAVRYGRDGDAPQRFWTANANAAHIARCDPDTMREILTLALSALSLRSDAHTNGEVKAAICAYPNCTCSPHSFCFPEDEVKRAYDAASAALQGTSAEIAVGELDRLVRAVLATVSAETQERYAILNHLGEQWTSATFASEADAVRHLAKTHVDVSGFKIVPRNVIRRVADVVAAVGDFDIVRGLIQEAKGLGGGGVVDHLDAAETHLNNIETLFQSMSAVLAPFETIAKDVAANNPGWDHDGFQISRRMSFAPFRAAARIRSALSLGHPIQGEAIGYARSVDVERNERPFEGKTSFWCSEHKNAYYNVPVYLASPQPPTPAVCKACDGTGSDPLFHEAAIAKCKVCNGTGQPPTPAGVREITEEMVERLAHFIAEDIFGSAWDGLGTVGRTTERGFKVFGFSMYGGIRCNGTQNDLKDVARAALAAANGAGE